VTILVFFNMTQQRVWGSWCDLWYTILLQTTDEYCIEWKDFERQPIIDGIVTAESDDFLSNALYFDLDQFNFLYNNSVTSHHRTPVVVELMMWMCVL